LKVTYFKGLGDSTPAAEAARGHGAARHNAAVTNSPARIVITNITENAWVVTTD
jgi:hypothetical protein